MKQPKIHLRRNGFKKPGHAPEEVWDGQAACGQPTPNRRSKTGCLTVKVTELPSLVTCKHCKQWFAPGAPTTKRKD